MIEYTRNVRAVSGASQVTGGGVISLGGFTLTVPATGTAALLATGNIFTAVQLFPDGAAAAPSIGFANNTNMGFFRPNSNQIGVVISGTERVRFSISGSDSVLALPGSGQITFAASSSVASSAAVILLGRTTGFFESIHSTALTNTAANVWVSKHQSSGTPAAGFGSAVVVQGKSSTTNDQDMRAMTTTWVVATHASRTSRTVWSQYDTAAREVMRGEASGSAPMIGFLGAAAVARTAAYTPTNVTTDRSYDANATTLDEIADVLGTLLADLQGFGLLG